MPVIVLTLRFDERLAHPVQRLWDVLAEEGVQQDDGLPRYRPHITIAAYEVDGVAPLCAALPGLAGRVNPFPLGLHSLGVFPETGTVVLAPRMTEGLFSLHREILHYLSPLCGAPLYPQHLLPDHWVPHCTLATRLPPDDVPRVIRICQQHWQPLEGLVEAIGLLLLPASRDQCEATLEAST